VPADPPTFELVPADPPFTPPPTLMDPPALEPPLPPVDIDVVPPVFAAGGGVVGASGPAEQPMTSALTAATHTAANRTPVRNIEASSWRTATLPATDTAHATTLHPKQKNA
jgi:hypothetical protein